MKEDVPPPESMTLGVLMQIRDWSQKKLASRSGLHPDSISRYLRKDPPPLDRLYSLAELMGFSRAFVERVLALVIEGLAELAAAGPLGPDEPTRREINTLAVGYGREVETFVRDVLTRLVRDVDATEARRQAPNLWRRLRDRPPEVWKALVEEIKDFHNWALCELLWQESIDEAANEPIRAEQIATLAVTVARLVPGSEEWRAALEARSWAFIGNARRVQGELPEADAAFARHAELWRIGKDANPGLLDPSRALDLEASLRREQRRLQEAFDLLEQARALAQSDGAIARVLLKKAKTFEELRDYHSALATLQEAEPYVEGSGDLWLLFSLLFNRLENRFQVGQHDDLEGGLLEIRSLAIELRSDLHLIRVTWLEGRFAAGLGKLEEALAFFSRVRDEFKRRVMHYDLALVLLETAVALLGQGRHQEAKKLAAEMAPIFRSKGVHREALVALRLFRDAAEREQATLELARGVLDYLQRARNNPRLRFEDNSDTELTNGGVETAKA